MTKKQIERNREFLKDLRKNRKKAKGALHKDGGHCCLGVACNTAKRLGLEFDDTGCCVAPPDVRKFYGWKDENPDLKTPWGEDRSAAALNDGFEKLGIKPMSHKRIADCFEATFPKLKA
jgi:hypothetical protein